MFILQFHILHAWTASLPLWSLRNNSILIVDIQACVSDTPYKACDDSEYTPFLSGTSGI